MILIKNTSLIEYDDLLEKAIKICVQYDAVSPSLFQRRLEVGYARASRLIDQLEFAGILESSRGNNLPRKVLTFKNNKTTKKSPFFKEGSEGYLMSCAQLIKYTLEAHGIWVRVNSIEITSQNICFYMEVALGTIINKILKLKKELALSLASPTGNIIIAAPFKGTSLVALYLPTKNNLRKASYRVINEEFVIKPPQYPYLYAIKTFFQRFFLRISNYFYDLAYKI